MTTLVLGASGFVGAALVDALLARHVEVRAASRHPEKSARRGLTWVHCDVRDEASLAEAMRGVKTIYYLVHRMHDGGAQFREEERLTAEAVARAAREARVRRIVYLGGVAPRGEASEHLASRLDVGEILRHGHVQTIELRAAMIIGNGSASWQILRDLASRLPAMVLPKWLESKSSPIALADVIDALCAARTLAIEDSAWFDLAGPETLSARQMLMIVGELLHRRIPAIRVPLLTPRLSARWLRLISGADYEVARELVGGLSSDLLPHGRRFYELTGTKPRRTFREAARDALDHEAPKKGLRGWLAKREERVVQRIFRAA